MPATAPVTRRDLLEAVIASGKMVSRIEIKEVTMGPQQSAPLHLHPCPVVGVVTAGAIAYQIEGGTVRHLKIGDAFYEPADVRVARFDNEGDTPARFGVLFARPRRARTHSHHFDVSGQSTSVRAVAGQAVRLRAYGRFVSAYKAVAAIPPRGHRRICQSG